MASGHVNRTNRPNTWLHRPTCKREERPCQLGAVHTWHKADMLGQAFACPLLERSGHAEKGFVIRAEAKSAIFQVHGRKHCRPLFKETNSRRTPISVPWSAVPRVLLGFP